MLGLCTILSGGSIPKGDIVVKFSNILVWSKQ